LASRGSETRCLLTQRGVHVTVLAVANTLAEVLAMEELPKPFQDFKRDFPTVHESYEALASAAHDAGPLDPKTRRLVKLGISIGGRLEGAVRAHTRQAKDAGLSVEELEHVALLALTTIGLPTTVAARSWIRDELGLS